MDKNEYVRLFTGKFSTIFLNIVTPCMLPFKKLTVHYFSPANRFYKAKLEQNNQVITLSQEEALKLIASTTWTSTESRQINDNKRSLIEKTFLLSIAP